MNTQSPRAPGLSIGEAARTVGVSAATLRLWERQGLIHPRRTGGGARRYGEEHIALLRRILYLRRAERLNPPAIARILRKRPAGPERTPDPRRRGPHLGDRLRARRRRIGMTLRQVAERTGLSVSLLSAIERGTRGLSIPTLRKLTSTYRTTVHDLLRTHQDTRRLVRAGQRPRLPVSGSGVRIEQLAVGPYRMDPTLFLVDPGAGSEGAYDHAGEEFVFVLRGTIEIWLDEREHYVLRPGDCLYFPSTLPHRWRNPGRQQAQLLWVNTPPTF